MHFKLVYFAQISKLWLSSLCVRLSHLILSGLIFT